MPPQSAVEGLHSQLAEFALQSKSQSEFRNAWLAALISSLGIDCGSACSTSDGTSYAIQTVNADGLPLKRGMAVYVAEVDSDELLLMRARTVLDDQVWSAQRRDSLSVYSDYLAKLGTVRYAMRCWVREGNVFFIFFSKLRGTKQFVREDLAAIDALFPTIALGEALHTGAEKQQPTKRVIAELDMVSRAERNVVLLAQRGLTNAEIASITGTALGTVRNQLSSAYRKLGVANRTELAFLLSGLEG